MDDWMTARLGSRARRGTRSAWRRASRCSFHPSSHPSHAFIHPRRNLISRIDSRIAVCTAAVLVLVCGLWRWFSMREQPQVSQAAPQQFEEAAPVEPAPIRRAAQLRVERSGVPPPTAGPTRERVRRTVAQAVGRRNLPWDVLEALEREYKRAATAPMARPKVFRDIMAYARPIAEKGPTAEQRHEALQLIFRCHAQLGEPLKAQQAFLAYADALGAEAKSRAREAGRAQTEADAAATRVTAEALLAEAGRSYDAKDLMVALSYCDVLLTRYPGTEVAARAQMLVGRHYDLNGQPSQAIAAFRAAIKHAPQSKAAMRARVSLPAALGNCGRPGEAAQAWLDVAELATTDSRKANRYYNAAVVLASCGKRHYPRAIQMLRMVIEKFPAAPYARIARRRLRRLELEIEDDILRNAPLP